ncbi:hypothetical protein ABIB44_000223 [Hymenobacter sp. UYCo722]
MLSQISSRIVLESVRKLSSYQTHLGSSEDAKS